MSSFFTLHMIAKNTNMSNIYAPINNRGRKANSNVASRLADNRRVDPDDFASRVDQRPA